MTGQGQVSVELRLVMTEAINQMRAFAKGMQYTLGGKSPGTGMADVAAQTNKAAAAQDNLARKTKQTTTELQKQLAEWRKLNPGGIAPGQKITFTDQPGAASTRFARWYPGKTEPMTGGGLATGIPYLGPVPPILPKIEPPKPEEIKKLALNQTLVRSLFGAVAGSYFSGPVGAGLGASAMGASGPMAIAIGAGTAAIKALRESIESLKASITQAAKQYASAMTSGMPLGFNIRRQTLASIIGVSGNEVFMFGKQIEYLNPQLNNAVNILTATNKNLTQVDWQWKILQTDTKAMADQLTNDAAPALLLFTSALDVLVKKITDWSKYIVMVAALTPQGMSIMRGAMDIIGKDFTKLTGGGTMPGPMAYMKQLPASDWERMGLQVGTFGGTNYAMQTANNTKPLPELLMKIFTAITGINKNDINRWHSVPNTP